MKTLRGSLVVLSILALALMLGVIAHGSGLILLSHGIDPLPTNDDGSGIIAHGIDPLPTNDDGSGIVLAHGIDPLPTNDDGSGIVA